MPTSIIVYRNPIEQAFWEGNYPNIWPIILGVCIFVLVAAIVQNSIIEKHVRWHSYNMYSYTNLVVSAVIGFLVARYMWI